MREVQVQVQPSGFDSLYNILMRAAVAAAGKDKLYQVDSVRMHSSIPNTPLDVTVEANAQNLQTDLLRDSKVVIARDNTGGSIASRELVKDALEDKFNCKTVTIKIKEPFGAVKYELAKEHAPIFFHMQLNHTHLPSSLNPDDCAKLVALLKILGIKHAYKHGELRVKMMQWREITVDNISDAFMWTLQEGLEPIIHTRSLLKGDLDGFYRLKEKTVMDAQNRARREFTFKYEGGNDFYFNAEKYLPSLQKPLEDNLNFQFNSLTWNCEVCLDESKSVLEERKRVTIARQPQVSQDA